MNERTRWWGDHEIAQGAGLRFLIGPLELRVFRGPVEWQLGWRRSEDASLARCAVDPLEGEVAPPDFDSRRVAGAVSDGPLTMSVRLPERPFVCRPESPFAILPGGEVTIYISTPVTVVLERGQVLAEVLAFRPSDTWLGATPRAGELAYFTRTRAATSRDVLSRNPSRAVSALRLQNSTSEAVEMTRISLPVPQLNVYEDDAGALLTDDVEVVFSEVAGKVTPEVSLSDGERRANLVGRARTPPDRARLSRVLWGFFS